MNNIEFITSPEVASYAPEPKPASHFFPEWYKEMEMGEEFFRTMKACVPVRDALSLGYIIPMWADVKIKTEGEEVKWKGGVQNTRNILFNHGKEQVKGTPLENDSFCTMKFHNPWVIKTPPGYSCLIIPPMYRQDDRFVPLQGVVDTDKYHHSINFSFRLLTGGETIIEKGTPLVQIIPFKRDNWQSVIKVMEGDEHPSKWILLKLGSKVKDGYKKLFWTRKTFK